MLGLIGMLLFSTEAHAGKFDRLQQYEKDHFEALRVFFRNEKKETKQYLREKTPEARDQWLKDFGYWDKFYKYDEYERAEIVAKEPKLGWTQDMVYMAWGPPHEKLNNTKRTASSSRVFVYRMEVNKDGEHLVWAPGSKDTYKAIEKYMTLLTIDNHAVTNIETQDGWRD